MFSDSQSALFHLDDFLCRIGPTAGKYLPLRW
jgi:hypothetical protein